jgi:hypothetical protein
MASSLSLKSCHAEEFGGVLEDFTVLWHDLPQG